MTKLDLKGNPFIQLVDEMARLQGRVTSLFDQVHEESGLKSMEEIVLTAIFEADTPPTVPQIGRSLGHPRQVIQRAVNDLADEGFIERLTNPDHKRAPLLAVTTKGEKLKQRTDAIALSIAERFLQHVNSATCTELAIELRAVRKALEAFSREQGETK